MRRLVVALLLFLEPLHFAMEALSVLPTLAYRGGMAGGELLVHGMVAALCTAGALALWNGAIDARRLATIAVAAAVARRIQSLYWSSLPDNTRPGDELFAAAVAVLVGGVAVLIIRQRST